MVKTPNTKFIYRKACNARVKRDNKRLRTRKERRFLKKFT